MKKKTSSNFLNLYKRTYIFKSIRSCIFAARYSATCVFFIFDFAFRRAGLNRHPSGLVCSLNLTLDEYKTRFNSIEKKIPKRFGARTQPCFTPLMIVNNSETLPSYCTVVFMLVWKDFTMLKRALEGSQSSTVSQTVLLYLSNRKL